MKVLAPELRTEVPPTLEAVEDFCADFQRWRAEECAEVDAFSTELLLREALTNSVMHGCRDTPDRKIFCVLRVKPGRLLIAIRDGGKGFDWRSAWDRQAEPADTHGRGIEILRLYSSAVRFNHRGNSMTLIKRF